MQIKAFGQVFESEEAYWRHLDCKKRFERSEEYIKNVDNMGLLLGGLIFAIFASLIGAAIAGYFLGQ